MLIEPHSAHFSGLHTVEADAARYVCGAVTAKDKAGHAIGAAFVYAVASDLARVDDGGRITSTPAIQIVPDGNRGQDCRTTNADSTRRAGGGQGRREGHSPIKWPDGATAWPTRRADCSSRTGRGRLARSGKDRTGRDGTGAGRANFSVADEGCTGQRTDLAGRSATGRMAGAALRPVSGEIDAGTDGRRSLGCCEGDRSALGAVENTGGSDETCVVARDPESALRAARDQSRRQGLSAGMGSLRAAAEHRTRPGRLTPCARARPCVSGRGRVDGRSHEMRVGSGDGNQGATSLASLCPLLQRNPRVLPPP